MTADDAMMHKLSMIDSISSTFGKESATLWRRSVEITTKGGGAATRTVLSI